MAKSNTKRKLVGLVSEVSGHRTYYTTKNTQNTTEKISIKKMTQQFGLMHFIQKPKKA